MPSIELGEHLAVLVGDDGAVARGSGLPRAPPSTFAVISEVGRSWSILAGVRGVERGLTGGRALVHAGEVEDALAVVALHDRFVASGSCCRPAAAGARGRSSSGRRRACATAMPWRALQHALEHARDWLRSMLRHERRALGVALARARAALVGGLGLDRGALLRERASSAFSAASAAFSARGDLVGLEHVDEDLLFDLARPPRWPPSIWCCIAWYSVLVFTSISCSLYLLRRCWAVMRSLSSVRRRGLVVGDAPAWRRRPRRAPP